MTSRITHTLALFFIFAFTFAISSCLPFSVAGKTYEGSITGADKVEFNFGYKGRGRDISGDVFRYARKDGKIIIYQNGMTIVCRKYGNILRCNCDGIEFVLKEKPKKIE